MFQETVYSDRVKKLKQKLNPNTLYLFSNPSHISYFTGFQFLVPNEREAFFICGSKTAALIHTSFAPLCNSDFLTYFSGTFPAQLQFHFEDLVKKTNAQTLFYDPTTLFVAELDSISKVSNLRAKPMEQNPANELLKQKDTNEISAIKKACKITARVLKEVQLDLQKGMTELDVADLIETAFKKNGVKQLAFPTIVGFAANSALPHHQPNNKKLENDTVVLIDIGAKLNNYCADMTRTFWFGPNPSPQFKKIETIVRDAQNAALVQFGEHHKRTVLAKDIDNAARIHISNQGYGDNFIHTTGHGLGLDIHEAPSLSWRNSEPITANMTITVEPGIYLEDNFGYRYEDTILTTATGYEILTTV
ncbi:MAG: aminopeptidase [Patescibacteria group bacterium]|nr:MAG: aminopeptidase [Patescibacteria group bacterium]